MPDKTHPPIVVFESLWLYPFLLGLFNSALLVGLISFSAAVFWQSVTRSTSLCGCFSPEIFSWSDLFPEQIPLSRLLLWLIIYLSACLIETLTYTYQSAQQLGYRKGLLSLPLWLLRTALKNSLGLCLLLAAMAQPSTVAAYALSGLACGFFIYWSQQGEYRQYALGLNKGLVWPQPGKLSFKIARYTLIIYGLLIITQSDILLPLGIFLYIVFGTLWISFKKTRA